MAEKMIRDNSFKVQDQDEYQRKYNELIKKHDLLQKRLEKNEKIRASKQQKQSALNHYLNNLEKYPESIIGWDNELWNLLVEVAIVHQDKSITFKFKNGKSIKIKD